jgi:DnaJ C terminal domain
MHHLSHTATFRCTVYTYYAVLQERKVLEVVISPGMKNGQKISFHGEADEAPGIQPGSVIFVVQEKPHDVFKRKVLHILRMLCFGAALCAWLCALDCAASGGCICLFRMVP